MSTLDKNEISIDETIKELENYLAGDGKFSAKQIEDLLKYSQMVLETNQHLNLTAITDAEGFYTKHILDSLSLLEYIDELASRSVNDTDDTISMLDVGSGAGFPGIPLKIMRPEIKLVMLDSLKKRVNFLNEIISEFKFEQAEAVHARAEDLAHQTQYRETFDLVSARAVAKLPSLLELTLPFVKTDGLFLAMKSSSDELSSSNKALNILGGKFISVDEFELPLEAGSRTIIRITKNKNTPKKYPRQAGTPTKAPLI